MLCGEDESDPEADLQILLEGRVHLAASKGEDNHATTSGGEGGPVEVDGEFHANSWFGHRRTWVTFEKLKEKYWWRGMYGDVVTLISSYESKQERKS